MKALCWLLGLVLLACLLGLAVGAVSLAPRAVVAALLSPDAPDAAIVRDLRLPRVLLAFLVGGALGVSGAALQALVRNPLADPYLLGISGGAGLAAVLAMALGLGGAWGVPFVAFLGGLAAVGLVYRLSTVAGSRLDPRVLVLAGVVVSAFTGSLMTAVLTLSNAEQLRNAFLWLLGGFSGASWRTVTIFAVYAILPLGLLLGAARALDLLTLGEEPAQSLGLDAPRARRLVYLATSLLTACSVAVCGVVGFVGLVAPHALRGILGPGHRRLLPAVFLASGGFLVLADALARTVARPVELPVGVVTALVGVPLFAVLLKRTLR
ncbi:MAG TPA: iron ABC transporter permease [Gemmatimonadales bacterium]|jgi:iron complex transport system permease protein|nr:iron ABC transporter permease [Gemmatimonadales bacterium]